MYFGKNLQWISQFGGRPTLGLSLRMVFALHGLIKVKLVIVMMKLARY